MQSTGTEDVARPEPHSVRVPGFGVDLYWLPMGVRGRWLHVTGKVFEAVAAVVARRTPLDLYHSVLEVRTRQGRFVIEMGSHGRPESRLPSSPGRSVGVPLGGGRGSSTCCSSRSSLTGSVGSTRTTTRSRPSLAGWMSRSSSRTTRSTMRSRRRRSSWCSSPSLSDAGLEHRAGFSEAVGRRRVGRRGIDVGPTPLTCCGYYLLNLWALP